MGVPSVATSTAPRTMGTGKKARDRRVVWQWSFKR